MHDASWGGNFLDSSFSFYFPPKSFVIKHGSFNITCHKECLSAYPCVGVLDSDVGGTLACTYPCMPISPVKTCRRILFILKKDYWVCLSKNSTFGVNFSNALDVALSPHVPLSMKLFILSRLMLRYGIFILKSSLNYRQGLAFPS